MKLIEIISPDFSFEDERGVLTQITHQTFAQTNAIFSRKGKVRGDYHYHRFSKEIFFIISGSVKVQLKYEDQYEEYHFGRGDMFLINENIKHRFEYEEDTYLVVFYSERIELDDESKDIVSD